ncbi:MAG: flagellar biosynthesis protein FlhA [Rhodothermales bacterium]|nr:flagellar biosynthesis protein FlhA [Rhodothermales bacterium]
MARLLPSGSPTLEAPPAFKLFNGEGLMAVTMIMILFVMVVPLPGFVLDMLLATNIALSIGILLTAFYAVRPLEFAIFPGLLLMTTLFRLSLNVASTRLILSEGEAGQLITAFGQFVVAGNYVVGAIIFLVLVIINFVVITKGSGRIAEVGARFTLDAMPGKQMAIDAELNAGLIDETEARQRREEVSREADFYGAMDGASKFVRGDAVAGLIITAINIVGGLIVGMLQQGMSFTDAAETFVLLSIGDGLVAQIPSLLISTSAGLIVSRASNASNWASEFKTQLFNKPHPILITGLFLAALGLVPGLPLLPFWLLAGAMVLLGRHRIVEDLRSADEHATLAGAPAPSEMPDTATDLLLVDPLELEIGYALISIVDPNQQGDLLDRVRMLRQQLALELGIVIPPVRIRDNVSMGANQYAIKLRGNPIGEGEIMPGYYLALLPDDIKNPPSGIKVKDPTFGLPALWIAERNLPEAERLGLTVVEGPAVITTHLLEVLRKNAYRLLDRQEVKKLVDKVSETAPALVEELSPNLLSVGAIQKVLKRLLQETVPIRDLVTILESLADHATLTKNIDVLTEYARAALSATISRQYAGTDGTLHAIVLAPELEQLLLEKAQQGELNPSTLGLQQAEMERLVKEADRLTKKLISNARAPVLLTSPVLRATLFNFLSPMLADITVLSYNDLIPSISVEVIEPLKLKQLA